MQDMLNLLKNESDSNQETTNFNTNFKKTSVTSYFLILLQGTLKLHISVVHEKKKPFMCDLCGSSNSTRQRLKRHIEVVHKGIKKHQCSICEARFSSTYNMRLHIASTHEKKKLYQCSLCSDSFDRKENLVSHITSVHSLEPTSPDRSETFFHTPFHE